MAVTALVIGLLIPLGVRVAAAVTGLRFLVEFLTEGQRPWLSRGTAPPASGAVGRGRRPRRRGAGPLASRGPARLLARARPRPRPDPRGQARRAPGLDGGPSRPRWLRRGRPGALRAPGPAAPARGCRDRPRHDRAPRRAPRGPAGARGGDRGERGARAGGSGPPGARAGGAGPRRAGARRLRGRPGAGPVLHDGRLRVRHRLRAGRRSILRWPGRSSPGTSTSCPTPGPRARRAAPAPPSRRRPTPAPERAPCWPSCGTASPREWTLCSRPCLPRPRRSSTRSHPPGISAGPGPASSSSTAGTTPRSRSRRACGSPPRPRTGHGWSWST